MSTDVGKGKCAASLSRVYRLCTIGRMDPTLTRHELIHGTGKYPERIGIRVPHCCGTDNLPEAEIAGQKVVAGVGPCHMSVCTFKRAKMRRSTGKC